ncbi:MAG: hypothetical protein JWR07_472 [Nevskia sp.]|nr:hypothetical protein [Nevskia sp.]
MMNWALWLGVFLLVINTLATAGVAFSRIYDTQQKLLQIVLIWVIPVIGAVVCWNILREERRSWHPPGADSGLVDAGNSYSASGNYDHGHNHSHHGDGGGHDGGSGH